MPKISIDGRPVEVPDGATILEAAETLNIKIPTLCFLKDLIPLTSCMLCLVRVEGRENYLPACTAKAEEGMVVLNDDPEITSARRTALELILSDHAGDCMGPCQVACPAGMDIPEMLRCVAAGNYKRAVEIMKEHIALPAVTGYICPAPCEKACRRGQVDETIAVRLVKRCAAEIDLAEGSPYRPDVLPDINKKTAIIGAGPAGLAAAYYLQRKGVSCTVFDERDEPGGMLRYEILEHTLPGSVLDAEIDCIRALGVQFRQQVRIGRDLSLDELLKSFDAVFIGIGRSTADDLETLGFHGIKDGLKVDRDTLQTDIPGVFAGGDVRRGMKLAVRSLADGKKASESILQFLSGEKVAGPMVPFNTRMGKLDSEELAQFSNNAEKGARIKPADNETGLTSEDAAHESAFCLKCDCRTAESCRLRIYAADYQAKAAHYRGKRRPYIYRDEHSELIYEPGKCINCGICVYITERQKEKLGLTFIGRGFDVKVDVPFKGSVAEGLETKARQAVTACPTGALAFKNDSDDTE